MIEINRDDFILKADSIKNQIVINFEKICAQYNETNLHKLIIYQLLRTEGAILIELRDFDLAIKCFKSLKNYLFRW